MVLVFSSKVNDRHAWNNCSCVLPNFEYLCLNKFCNWGHVVFSNGSKDWYHNLASPSRVRQNLWTFTSLMEWWAFIHLLEHSKCASASSSGFYENSGLKFDQFICKCHCPAPSWFCCCWFHCWFYPCLWSGAAAPSSASAILILIYNLLISYPYLLHSSSYFLLSIPDMINLLLSNLNLSQMLEFDNFWKLVTILLFQVSSQTKNLFLIFFPFFWWLELRGFLLLDDFSTSESSSF